MGKEENKCSNCSTNNCFVKRFGTNEQITLVEMSKTTTQYKKDDYIFREGEIVFGIYFIKTGGVKVISDNLHGRQQIVRLTKEGNILGYRALGKTKYYFNAIAFIDTTLCFIDNELYHHLCRNNIDFTYNLMLHYAHELGRTGLRVKYQSQMNMREKIAEALLNVIEIFGIDSETKTLKLAITRQDIADLAGTTTEQVSRQLTEFEESKIIEREKRSIKILQPTILEDIVKMYKIA
jgi:CRP-like cAMP-binding protein